MSKEFTFICGADDFLVSRMAKALFEEKTRDLTDDFSREIVNGTSSKVADVEIAVGRFRQAVQTLPLFGEKKVVWLKEVNFLADSVTGRAEGTLAQVELLKDILENTDPQGVDIIVSASPVDRRRAFPKWCEKNTGFHLAGGKGKDSGLQQLIEEECTKLGVSITRDAQELLEIKVSGNTRLAIEELRKMATYLGGENEAIDDSLVAEMVPEFGESNFFETAEAFYSLDLQWTLEAIRRHFFHQKDGRGLITTLQGRNRLLIQLRVLHDAGEIRLGGRGLSSRDLQNAAQTYARHFGENKDKSNFNVFTQNPWYLGRLAGNIGKLPLRKLIDFQTRFLETFEALLQRPDEQEAVLRDLAVRCLG